MTGDLEKLQGTWNIASLAMDGNPLPAAFLLNARIDVKAARFIVRAMGTVVEADVVMDSSRTPATLDMAFTNGPEAGKTALGIYELDGDSWRVCFGFSGKPRPVAFESPKGSGYVLEQLRRA